jgi:syntaxin 16
MLAEEGGGSNNGGIQMSTLGKAPPAWVKHVDAVEQSLDTIKSQMNDLQALHSQRVGSVFGKNLDNMEGRIDKMTNAITDEMRLAERHLQAVGKQAAAATTAQEATVGANVQRSLAKRLQELSVTFRQSQRKYLAEVQAQKTGKVPEPYLGLLDEGGAGGGANGSAATEGEFFTSQQMAVVDDLTQAVQSRDAEIVQIAKSIEELGTIFKELAVLVIDQGTILDRIDYNMEAVVEHTKTGIQQLEKAERAQRSARPLRCIICLSILVFVLLILLVLKWTRWYMFNLH